MRETIRRWSEDETVGKALIVAGLIFLVVQAVPFSFIAWMKRLWPVALIGAGVLLLWKRRD